MAAQLTLGLDNPVCACLSVSLCIYLPRSLQPTPAGGGVKDANLVDWL